MDISNLIIRRLKDNWLSFSLFGIEILSPEISSAQKNVGILLAILKLTLYRPWHRYFEVTTILWVLKCSSFFSRIFWLKTKLCCDKRANRRLPLSLVPCDWTLVKVKTGGMVLIGEKCFQKTFQNRKQIRSSKFQIKTICF